MKRNAKRHLRLDVAFLLSGILFLTISCYSDPSSFSFLAPKTSSTIELPSKAFVDQLISSAREGNYADAIDSKTVELFKTFFLSGFSEIKNKDQDSREYLEAAIKLKDLIFYTYFDLSKRSSEERLRVLKMPVFNELMALGTYLDELYVMSQREAMPADNFFTALCGCSNPYHLQKIFNYFFERAGMGNEDMVNSFKKIFEEAKNNLLLGNHIPQLPVQIPQKKRHIFAPGGNLQQLFLSTIANNAKFGERPIEVIKRELEYRVQHWKITEVWIMPHEYYGGWKGFEIPYARTGSCNDWTVLTPSEEIELIKYATSLGVNVFFDIVENHTGRDGVLPDEEGVNGIWPSKCYERNQEGDGTVTWDSAIDRMVFQGPYEFSFEEFKNPFDPDKQRAQEIARRAVDQLKGMIQKDGVGTEINNDNSLEWLNQLLNDEKLYSYFRNTGVGQFYDIRQAREAYRNSPQDRNALLRLNRLTLETVYGVCPKCQKKHDTMALDYGMGAEVEVRPNERRNLTYEAVYQETASRLRRLGWTASSSLKVGYRYDVMGSVGPGKTRPSYEPWKNGNRTGSPVFWHYYRTRLKSEFGAVIPGMAEERNFNTVKDAFDLDAATYLEDAMDTMQGISYWTEHGHTGFEGSPGKPHLADLFNMFKNQPDRFAYISASNHDKDGHYLDAVAEGKPDAPRCSILTNSGYNIFNIPYQVGVYGLHRDKICFEKMKAYLGLIYLGFTPNVIPTMFAGDEIFTKVVNFLVQKHEPLGDLNENEIESYTRKLFEGATNLAPGELERQIRSVKELVQFLQRLVTTRKQIMRTTAESMHLISVDLLQCEDDIWAVKFHYVKPEGSKIVLRDGKEVVKATKDFYVLINKKCPSAEEIEKPYVDWTPNNRLSERIARDQSLSAEFCVMKPWEVKVILSDDETVLQSKDMEGHHHVRTETTTKKQVVILSSHNGTYNGSKRAMELAA